MTHTPATTDGPEAGMFRVVFAGDIHGNTSHLGWLFRRAAQLKADAIIACGDFGYWPHMDGGRFVDECNRLAESTAIPLYWVDGNHENHDLLDVLQACHGTDAPIETGGTCVKWIPRGCRFELFGVSFMGYGGAYSVDWDMRVPGVSWWEQELVDPDHVAALPEARVDVLVTHEAPLGKEISYKDNIPESVTQRELILEVQRKVRPALHVCGHHHTRETWDSDGTEVHVLGRDDMGNESILAVDFPCNQSPFALSTGGTSK